MGSEKYVIDFDELREKDEASFILGGKKYVIPPITYAVLVKITKLDKEMNKAIEANDVEQVLEKSIAIACVVVDDLNVEMLKAEASISEIRKIGELITQVMRGGEEEEEPESAYYRKKYGDEYRKNSQRTKKKEKE